MPKPPIEPDLAARAAITDAAAEITAAATKRISVDIAKRARAIARELDLDAASVQVGLTVDVRRDLERAIQASGRELLDSTLIALQERHGISERRAAEALSPIVGLQRYGVLNAFGERWARERNKRPAAD